MCSLLSAFSISLLIMSDAEAFPHLADFTVDSISEVLKGALRLTGGTQLSFISSAVLM